MIEITARHSSYEDKIRSTNKIKITADGKCSHEIKRHFLLGRKTMTYLDRILKSSVKEDSWESFGLQGDQTSQS